MTLLNVLAHHHDAVSLKLLSKETGLHPSTAHRILGAMVTSGFVERAEPGAYQLGIRLLELGNIVKSRINIRQVALPFMQTLHGQIGESVNLGVRHDDEIIYVERTSSGRSSVRVVHLVGARAPHLTEGHEAAEDLAALHRGAAVGDADVGAIDAGLDGFVRAGPLLLGGHEAGGHGEGGDEGRRHECTTLNHWTAP